MVALQVSMDAVFLRTRELVDLFKWFASELKNANENTAATKKKDLVNLLGH